MAASETRSAPISLRTFPDLKSEVEKLAQQEGRTLAQYVERVLQAHVDTARSQTRGHTQPRT